MVSRKIHTVNHPETGRIPLHQLAFPDYAKSKLAAEELVLAESTHLYVCKIFLKIILFQMISKRLSYAWVRCTASWIQVHGLWVACDKLTNTTASCKFGETAKTFSKYFSDISSSGSDQHSIMLNVKIH